MKILQYSVNLTFQLIIMKTIEFDYHLPKDLIAQYPCLKREESRLMVLHRSSRVIEHRRFIDIVEYFQPGDLLVINNTRVIPARLIGKKDTGGKVEVLLIPSRNGKEGEWQALFRGRGRIGKGTRIQFGDNFYGEVKELEGKKGKILFSTCEALEELLEKFGHIPLPPYIKREDEPLDRERYQTVFAEKDGSIAAPTAGLHFTPSLLKSLRERGVDITTITLHIGIGTFLPVKVSEIESHKMYSEWVEITEEAVKNIENAKARRGRIVALGTTTTRAIESFSDKEGRIKPGSGYTSLFIYPPYKFRVIDGLITNFHLPKSTLIMLVSAFAGRDFIMEAYREAVEKKYRFYSYGDAMLIL